MYSLELFVLSPLHSGEEGLSVLRHSPETADIMVVERAAIRKTAGLFERKSILWPVEVDRWFESGVSDPLAGAMVSFFQAKQRDVYLGYVMRIRLF